MEKSIRTREQVRSALAAAQESEREAMTLRHQAEWSALRLEHQNAMARLEAGQPELVPLTNHDRACIRNHPRVTSPLPFGNLADAIRLEVLHTFYNCYRGRSTRKEMVEEFEPFHTVLERNYEQFNERRGRPWIYYPTLKSLA